MYTKILIPTDGSTLSARAVEHGVKLAHSCQAEIVFVSVRRPLHSMDHEPSLADNMPEDYKSFVHAYLTSEQSEHLDAAQAIAEAAGVVSQGVCVENDDVYKAIIDAAQANGCDLIVMASHGRRGVSAVVLGSETTKVLTHSDIPVLVCR